MVQRRRHRYEYRQTKHRTGPCGVYNKRKRTEEITVQPNQALMAIGIMQTRTYCPHSTSHLLSASLGYNLCSRVRASLPLTYGCTSERETLPHGCQKRRHRQPFSISTRRHISRCGDCQIVIDCVRLGARPVPLELPSNFQTAEKWTASMILSSAFHS